MIIFYSLLVFFLMIILPTILILSLKNNPKALKISAICLAVIYFTLLFIGTTFRISIRNGNLSVYPDFSHQWFSMNFLISSFHPVNLTINIILLFPLGFIVFFCTKKHPFLKTIIFTFLLSLFIELYQFILPVTRTTELTDLFFNTSSGVISGLYCKILQKFGGFQTK